MYAKNVVALSALLSFAVAVPMVKRDVVWVTETAEDVVTVPVTTTVWVNPSDTASTNSHYGHHAHTRSQSTITEQSTVTAVPSAPTPSAPVPVSSVESSVAAPSSSEAPTTSSVYEAPTTSSVYVAPTTSSVYVAPTTTSSIYVAPTPASSTSVYVAPTPSSAYVAPTTSTSSAPAATSSTSSSGSGESSGPGAAGTSYTGDLTWYDTGLGSCGISSSASDHIVAISHVIMDAYSAAAGGNPNNNPMCGKTVTITGASGSPYTATVVDRCVGCAEGDLDLSQDFFNTVTNNGDGRVPGMSWSFS